MNRKIAVVAAALAAFAFVAPSAHAGGIEQALNPFATPVSTAGTIAGVGSTALYFGINHWKWDWDSSAAGISQAGAIVGTTIGCAAVAPMIGTALTGRPLTYREAGKLTVGCVIPIVGPLIVDALYDAHPEWEKVHPVKARYAKKRHYRRRH